jgi:hypothetical protein
LSQRVLRVDFRVFLQGQQKADDALTATKIANKKRATACAVALLGEYELLWIG